MKALRQTEQMAIATDAPFSAQEAQFLTHSPEEISEILLELMHGATLITAFFDDGGFALTAVVAVAGEPREVLFEMPPRDELVRKLLASPRVTMSINKDGIRIKFAVFHPRPVAHHGRTAFAVSMPEAVMRIQRRETYRVPCSITKPLKCVIAARAGAKSVTLEVVVLDISCGGIAIMDGHPTANLEAGRRYHGCRIELPGTGTLVCDVEVRNTVPVVLANETMRVRAGCRFSNLTPTMAGLVQRHIMRLERERNSRFRRS